MPNAPAPLRAFISYSHRDEAFKDNLIVHLATLKRQGKIRTWQDRDIEAGAEWDAEIKQQLGVAEIILLLITPHFLASDNCFDLEMQRAVQRHDEGTARVIPIIVKPCDWEGTLFSKLQVLPKDAKPITQWDDSDEAFLNVVKDIRRTVESLQTTKSPEAMDDFVEKLDSNQTSKVDSKALNNKNNTKVTAKPVTSSNFLPEGLTLAEEIAIITGGLTNKLFRYDDRAAIITIGELILMKRLNTKNFSDFSRIEIEILESNPIGNLILDSFMSRMREWSKDGKVLMTYNRWISLPSHLVRRNLINQGLYNEEKGKALGIFSWTRITENKSLEPKRKELSEILYEIMSSNVDIDNYVAFLLSFCSLETILYSVSPDLKQSKNDLIKLTRNKINNNTKITELAANLKGIIHFCEKGRARDANDGLLMS